MTWILYIAINLLTAIIKLIDDIDDAVTVQLSIAMASLSQTFDTTRNEIVAAMEQRIENGDHTKLIKQEFIESPATLEA